MSTAEITIRSIQHFLYCPHRWGLLEIEQVWAENLFVTKANLLHERVHDPDNHYTSRGKKVFTSVRVFHDSEPYNLYGVTDCLELTPDPNGVALKGSPEKYRICIVEYKPTKPKGQEYAEDDLMQVFAQKICVDFVFGGDCEGALYYMDVRQRIPLPLRTNFAQYDERLRALLQEMRMYLREGRVPPILKGQKCSGCSMKDLCMPAMKAIRNVQTEIQKVTEAPI